MTDEEAQRQFWLKQAKDKAKHTLGELEVCEAHIKILRQKYERAQEEVKRLEADIELAAVKMVVDTATVDAAGPQHKDYAASNFPWSRELMYTLQTVFQLRDFRSCQEGWVAAYSPCSTLTLDITASLINAAMAGRDILGVMPTG